MSKNHNKIDNCFTPRESGRYPWNNVCSDGSIPIDKVQRILQEILNSHENSSAEEFKSFMEGLNVGLAIKLEYGKKKYTTEYKPAHKSLDNEHLKKYTCYFFGNKDKARIFVERIKDVAKTFGKVTIRDADKVFAHVVNKNYVEDTSEHDILNDYGWIGWNLDPIITNKCTVVFPIPVKLDNKIDPVRYTIFYFPTAFMANAFIDRLENVLTDYDRINVWDVLMAYYRVDERSEVPFIDYILPGFSGIVYGWTKETFKYELSHNDTCVKLPVPSIFKTM